MAADIEDWGRLRWWLYRHGSVFWFLPSFGFLLLGFYLADVNHPWWGLLTILPALFCAEMGKG